MAITNENFCLTVMKNLKNLTGEIGDPMRNAQPVGLVDALTSPQNKAGATVQSDFSPGDGKNHKVILKHLTPDAIDDTDTTITNFCTDDGSSTVWSYDEVAIDLAVQSDVKEITEAEMVDWCDSENYMREEIIAGSMNSIRKKINRLLIPKFYAGVGGLMGGNGTVGTPYDMLVRTDGTLSVDPEGQIEMEMDLMDAGMNGNPILVGGRLLKKWAGFSSIACCNQYGVDASQMPELGFYYDNDMTSVLSGPSDSADQAFFAFAPRAAQLVARPQFVGEFRKVTDTFIKDTITDPRTGLTYDFHWSYDPCGDNNRGSYKFKFTLNFGLWQMPLTLYKSTDNRYKVNYNWSFQINERTAA